MIRGLLMLRRGGLTLLVVRCPKCGHDHGVLVERVDEWPDNAYQDGGGEAQHSWYYKIDDDTNQVTLRPSLMWYECGYHSPFEWIVSVMVLSVDEDRGPVHDRWLDG